MALALLELAPRESWPDLRYAAGVSPITEAERRLHDPNVTVVLQDDGEVVARCSCWWDGAPSADGLTTGVIGHYGAGGREAGATVLQRACELIAAAGRAVAIGPMDGNTWRRYRFVIERGDEPMFLLEPDNPDEWPSHWTSAGFRVLAHYTSGLNQDLAAEDSRTDGRLSRLERDGIHIRTIDPARVENELGRIYELSLRAFARNFLYTPIGESEFRAQYHAVLPFVRPELVLLAERGSDLAGFMFALPDVLQARRRGAIDTAILKTIAVDPVVAGSGLGGVMLDLVQRAARRSGFTRAIHALIHETNTSKRMSNRYARTIRRYALYSRVLTP